MAEEENSNDENDFGKSRKTRIASSIKGKAKPKSEDDSLKFTTVKPEKAGKLDYKQFPTLKIIDTKEIAMDFSMKCYEKFNKLIKSIVLFGSQVKNTAVSGSDIDLILIIDDASIIWDQELISWYREELGKLIGVNPYNTELHINSVRLTTWWQDLMRGDPVVTNILRYGEPLIDFGGFFTPQKVLLEQGKIRSTPEAIYAALQRTPLHLTRSKSSILSAVEGLYWAMVDSSHAALMAAKQSPPSPEHIPVMLKEIFVDRGSLKIEYVSMIKDLSSLHKRIVHGDITSINGKDVDLWQARTEQFVRAMTELVRKAIE